MCNVIRVLPYTVHETILQNLNMKSNILKHFADYVGSCPYDLESKKLFFKKESKARRK